MTEKQDPSHPKHPIRRLLLRELQDLLEAVQILYWRVRALLLESRLRPTEQSASPPRKPDIDAALDDYIQRTVSERQDQGSAGVGETERLAAPASKDKPADVRRRGEEAATAPPGVLAGFSKYLRRRSRSATMGPHLDEKLQQRTWEHITSAIKLAQQGKEDEAKLHAELAENAMTEASRYMAEAQYDALEKAVKEKLRTIAERN